MKKGLKILAFGFAVVGLGCLGLAGCGASTISAEEFKTYMTQETLTNTIANYTFSYDDGDEQISGHYVIGEQDEISFTMTITGEETSTVDGVTVSTPYEITYTYVDSKLYTKEVEGSGNDAVTTKTVVTIDDITTSEVYESVLDATDDLTGTLDSIALMEVEDFEGVKITKKTKGSTTTLTISESISEEGYSSSSKMSLVYTTSDEVIQLTSCELNASYDFGTYGSMTMKIAIATSTETISAPADYADYQAA